MSGKSDPDWAKFGLLKGDGTNQPTFDSPVPANDLYHDEQVRNSTKNSKIMRVTITHLF